jgi:adenine-specific DNA-methyltransferase
MALAKNTVEENKDKLVVRKVSRDSGLEYDVFEKDYYSESKISKIKSIFYEKEVNIENATEELAELFQAKVFDYPKPVYTIRKLIESINDSYAIVLDFFTGSGTTGHAVITQNSTDESNRRYILVQLPEILDPIEPSQKAAADFCDSIGKPRNLAEICKERLRRAGQKLKEDNPMFNGDVGFRVFKLDSSNIQAWEPDRDNLAATLEEHAEHLKADRTEQDILFELLLKLGLDLTVPIEENLSPEKLFTALAPVRYSCVLH